MKKIGSETPASATPIAARSKTVPRLSAETTPVATPAEQPDDRGAGGERQGHRQPVEQIGQTGFWVMNE